MIETDTELKRWTIKDKITGEIFDITDKAFSIGLEKHYLKLRGQYIQVENGHKIWIDAITK